MFYARIMNMGRAYVANTGLLWADYKRFETSRERDIFVSDYEGRGLCEACRADDTDHIKRKQALGYYSKYCDDTRRLDFELYGDD